MREIKFKYIWKRPDCGAGPYRPTDSKVLISYITLKELEDGKKPVSTKPYTYYLIAARCQYTDIKDKYGKEIYEGDIIWHNKYKINLQVIYSPENTGYDLVSSNHNMHLCSLCSPNLEVIGSIHES